MAKRRKADTAIMQAEEVVLRQRMWRAFEMKLEGRTWTSVARELEVDESTVHRDVEKASKEIQAHEAEFGVYRLDQATQRREMLLAMCLSELEHLPYGFAFDATDLASISNARAAHISNAAKNLEAIEGLRGLRKGEAVTANAQASINLYQFGDGPPRRIEDLSDDELLRLKGDVAPA